MALTTYRSKVAITNKPLRNAAYVKIAQMVQHLEAFDLNLLRIELMPNNFVEVDLNNPIPGADQVDHLGLQGPV